jgi:hypothetical protein
MPWTSEKDGYPVKEVRRLLNIQARALQQLEGVLADFESPGTIELLRTLRSQAISVIPDRVQEISGAIEEAIRLLKSTESEARMEFEAEPVTLDGLPDLPMPLARFLADRAEAPGFSYELDQDLVRGWVIRWKERTAEGTVRGSGQFYERPYAWIDD